MDMGQSGYLPWTQLRLYDWMKSRVSGVNINSGIVGGECCLSLNNKLYFSVGSISAAAAFEGVTYATMAALWQEPDFVPVLVREYAHETRHTEGNGWPHVAGCPNDPTTPNCDETYNVTNLSPYGIMYYLASHWLSGSINLGYSCDPATQAALGAAFVRMGNVDVGSFVTNPPAMLSLPGDPGGACIPASSFTLNIVPSQVNAGASLTLGVNSSDAQAGWTADSTVSWIVPIAGMNSVGTNQAVFTVNPVQDGSLQSGTVIVAGKIEH